MELLITPCVYFVCFDIHSKLHETTRNYTIKTSYSAENVHRVSDSKTQTWRKDCERSLSYVLASCWKRPLVIPLTLHNTMQCSLSMDNIYTMTICTVTRTPRSQNPKVLRSTGKKHFASVRFPSDPYPLSTNLIPVRNSL